MCLRRKCRLGAVGDRPDQIPAVAAISSSASAGNRQRLGALVELGRRIHGRAVVENTRQDLGRAYGETRPVEDLNTA